MSVKIGKAKFGGEFVKRKWWKLKDGESTYRILPPLGNLADAGKWSIFYNAHYGYKTSKGEMRVFQSPLVRDRKTRMVEVPDAALERIDALKAKQAAAKASGDKAVYDKLGEFLQQYNLDNNHHVNAMDEHGNIGILKLRHRAKLALDATIKSLRDSGVDPLDADTGRFFVFRRSGNGLDTTFQVGVKQRELDVPGVGKVKQDIVHVLDDGILSRLEAEAAQLDDLYKRPTSAEVARIVAESDFSTGKSPAVDEILNSKSNSASAESEDEYEEPTTTAAPVITPVAQAAAPVLTPTTTITPAAATIVRPVTVSAPKTTAQTVTDMTDADFLKSLGM